MVDAPRRERPRSGNLWNIQWTEAKFLSWDHAEDGDTTVDGVVGSRLMGYLVGVLVGLSLAMNVYLAGFTIGSGSRSRWLQACT